jgi:hypothetical protein
VTAARRLAIFDQCESSLALAKRRPISCDDQSGCATSGKFQMTGSNLLVSTNISLRRKNNSLRPGK